MAHIYTSKGQGKIVRKFVRGGEVIVVVRYADGSTEEWLGDEVSY